jgi:hypothetical protein
MRRALPLFFVLTFLLALTACGSAGPGAALKDLVPAEANLIAQVQVSEILQDPDLATLYDQTPKNPGDPQTFQELLAQTQEETGIDFRQFNTAILFGDITRDNEYFGVIAQGPVNQEQFLSAMQEQSEPALTSIDYKGRQIHVGQKEEDTLALSFLEGNVLVMGSLPAVQAVIDVQEGDQPRVSGKVYDAFVRLGNPLFSMALAAPPEALTELEDSLGDGEGFGMMPAMTAFQDLDVVSLVVDKPGSDLKMEAQLEFFTADSADRMGNTLDGFLKLAAGFSSNEESSKILEKLQLKVDGTRLTLNFQAPIADLREVASSTEGDLEGQD